MSDRMGTHPSGPASVEDGPALLDILKSNPSLIGVIPPEYECNDLPFLFKVLSIRTALSIQVRISNYRLMYGVNNINY